MKLSRFERMKYMLMFKDYLRKYGHKYDPENVEFMKENFLKLVDQGETPDILLQLYCKFGIIPEDQDIYRIFAKMIGDKYGWSTNILEIAGGFYPIFSKYVDDKQQEVGRGTITVIDPLIVTDKLGNVKLQKQSFSSDMDVSDFELLVGICPCDATKDIIESAVINKKEFFVALCGCIHYGYGLAASLYGQNAAYNMLVNDVYDYARQQEKYGFEVKKEFIDGFPYPIISSKQR